jgi:hypothetical protein
MPLICRGAVWRYLATKNLMSGRMSIFLSLIVFAGIMLIKSDLKKTLFAITDEAVILKSRERVQPIFFNDITLCKHMKSPFGGHIQIISPGKSITIPFFIVGIHDLLLRLHEALIINGKPSVIEEPYCGSMIKLAYARRFTYSREKKAFGPLLTSSFLLTFINLFIAYKLWKVELFPILLWSGIGFLIPILIFSLSEFLINKKITLTSTNHLETTEYDYLCQSTYLLSALIFIIIYFLIGNFFTLLF